MGKVEITSQMLRAANAPDTNAPASERVNATRVEPLVTHESQPAKNEHESDLFKAIVANDSKGSLDLDQSAADQEDAHPPEVKPSREAALHIVASEDEDQE